MAMIYAEDQHNFSKNLVYTFITGTEEQLSKENKVLNENEISLNISKREIKVGNGETPWNDLKPWGGNVPQYTILAYGGPIQLIPDEYAICDGRVVDGFKTPDLRDKFLKGSGTVAQTGGSNSLTLTMANMPQHNHGFTGNKNEGQSVTTSEAGDHTHARGTMDITGQVTCGPGDDEGPFPGKCTATGAFSTWHAAGMNGSDGASGYGAFNFDFVASRSWTGNTSSNGKHKHTFSIGGSTPSGTIGYAGSSQAFNNQPAYYTVIYIIKYKA